MIKVNYILICLIYLNVSCSTKNFPPEHPSFASAKNNEAHSEDLGRKVIYRDRGMYKYLGSESGKILFKICINRNGTPTSVEYIEEESTIYGDAKIKKIINGLMNYRYQPDSSAPEKECGNFTLSVDMPLK